LKIMARAVLFERHVDPQGMKMVQRRRLAHDLRAERSTERRQAGELVARAEG
jgi:hypothetical protein